ncbi:MAG: isoprenylcysteine carboxylmethyltransferase family protein [Chloroflexi bacterium]|nr:isoprenylcysteine carboxylmethyltransferase family protein [Chloroflexota bacterium]
MTIVYKAILFALLTTGIVWVSRSSLRDVRYHGFYRFFAWETILILFLMNVDYWFVDPFAPRQIVSWSFLIVSLVLIYQGVLLFRRKGNLDQGRDDPALIGIEKTTELVTTGVYRYIRHPFYSSLLFLGWGILLKNVSWLGLLLAAITTLFLIITARKEETENIRYFGETYREYMERTKMFVPYIF